MQWKKKRKAADRKFRYIPLEKELDLQLLDLRYRSIHLRTRGSSPSLYKPPFCRRSLFTNQPS